MKKRNEKREEENRRICLSFLSFSTSSFSLVSPLPFSLSFRPPSPQPRPKLHSIDEKIKKLDAQLVGHREAIRKARPGAPQDAAKRRALAVLKQKKMLEAQRDQLYNQQFNMEQTSFALESVKDSVATVQAMKAAGAELKTAMRDKNLVRGKERERERERERESFYIFSGVICLFSSSSHLSLPPPPSTQQQDISGIESLQDDMADLMDSHAEIQEALGQTFGLPDDVDEDELLGELDALEDELAAEASAAPAAGEGASAAPSYLSEETCPRRRRGQWRSGAAGAGERRWRQ